MKTILVATFFVGLFCANVFAQELERERPAGPLEISEESLEVLQIEAPARQTYFAVSSETYKLANGPARKWDGCAVGALVRGGYDSDVNCSSGYFHPLFVKHLEDHFFTCVERASLDANFRQPRGIFVHHLGTYVNRNGRNSDSLSMHAYARGFDLAKLILTDGQGGKTFVPLTKLDYKGPTKQFYDSFRQCWKDSLPSACRPGLKEYKGSIGHASSALGGNSLHEKHIHLSLPFCAG